MSAKNCLEVYHAGVLTVVGFGGREVLDGMNLVQCRDEITKLVEDHDCKFMAFDMTDVLVIPSGLLGLLASIHRLGVEVQLFNASEDIREVLEITRLDQVIHLYEVDLSELSVA